jgi:phosphatidate cytidylyltransferase
VKRTLTGILIVGVILAGLLINSLSFLIVFVVVMGATLWEFYHMLHRLKVRVQVSFGIGIGVVMFLLSFLVAIRAVPEKTLVLILLFLPFVFIHEIYAQHNRPFHNIAYTFLGLIYIALPFSLLSFLVFDIHEKVQPVFALDGKEDILNFLLQPGFAIDYSPDVLLGVFLLIWIYDTGAYVSGMLFGKHRLLPRISPKKTWEGLIGGAVLALAGGLFMARFFTDIGKIEWVLVVFIVVVFGTLGDLTESLLKRRTGVKDSGSILPGHGGFLDRFDSFLLIIPVVTVLVIFLEN